VIVGSSSLAAFAFSTYPSAPASKAARHKSASLSCVTNTTLVRGDVRRIRAAASRPLIIGIPMSRSTTSGLRCITSWTASKPSHALPTIRHSWRMLNMSRRRLRHPATSSMMRICSRMYRGKVRPKLASSLDANLCSYNNHAQAPPATVEEVRFNIDLGFCLG